MGTNILQLQFTSSHIYNRVLTRIYWCKGRQVTDLLVKNGLHTVMQKIYCPRVSWSPKLGVVTFVTFLWSVDEPLWLMYLRTRSQGSWRLLSSNNHANQPTGIPSASSWIRRTYIAAKFGIRILVTWKAAFTWSRDFPTNGFTVLELYEPRLPPLISESY